MLGAVLNQRDGDEGRRNNDKIESGEKSSKFGAAESLGGCYDASDKGLGSPTMTPGQRPIGFAGLWFVSGSTNLEPSNQHLPSARNRRCAVRAAAMLGSPQLLFCMLASCAEETLIILVFPLFFSNAKLTFFVAQSPCR